MTNTLTVVIGDSTRPKIEKKEDLKASFFQDTYQKAFGLVSDIVSNFKEEKDDNTRNDYYQQIRNNIIAFVGDRGSGKTSCLQTVYQVLECYDKTTLKYIVDLFEEEFKEKIRKNFEDVTFRTLPTIDPSYFEEKSNILEIILANMFLTFKEHASKTQASNNNESYLEKKRNLVTCFQKAKDALDKINGEDIKSSNDSIEKLSELSAGINMKKRMTDLVKKYLEYFDNKDSDNKRNHKILLIAIDDMDIQTEHAFKMVEQMRKYLIISNVIILVGVKLTQLTDIVKQAYYEEYNTIINKKSLSDTVENMAGRYLSKLIPYNHRIFLPDLEIELNRKIKIVNTEEEEFDRIDMAVLHLIYRKTRYMFYNSDTGTSLVVPRNLRDLLNLCSLLYGMKTIYKDKDKAEDYITHIQKNRIQFRKYFVESWCYEHLDSESYKFIHEVYSSNIEEVNKKITDYLCNICKDNQVPVETRLAHSTNRAYNVALADVGYYLDKVDGIKNKPFLDYFVFALRTVYSMLLYETIEKEDINSDITLRKEIFETRIGMNPDKKVNKALKKANKLLIYTNYERLLGGELLHFEHVFNRKEAESKGKIVYDEDRYFDERKPYDSDNPLKERIHHHAIDIKLLRNLYKFASEEDKTHLKPEYQNIGYNLGFRICEFFLLTIYSTNSSPFYRSYKHCYYDNLPNEILEGGGNVLVYNTLSILFNTVKYYNYYKQYLQIPNKENSENKFLNFWNKAVAAANRAKEEDEKAREKGGLSWIRNNSLIIQFMRFAGEGDKPPVKEEPFQNEYLEQTFIRNLDVLDILQDYLPFKNSPLSDGDIFTDLRKYYKILSEFEFYLYPKEKSGNNKTIKFDIFNIISNFLEELEDKKNEAAKNCFLEIFKGQVNPTK